MNLESDDEEKFSKLLSIKNESTRDQNATEHNATIIINSMKQGFMPKWILEKTFPDHKTAFNQITEEEIWTVELPRCYTCPEGRNVLYRCNRAKKSGIRCPVLKTLFFLNNTEEAYLFKTVGKHYHDKSMPAIKKFQKNGGDPLVTKSTALEITLKQRIQKLILQINAPKVMFKRLEDEGFDVYSRITKIRNYIAYLRNQKHFDKWKLEKTFSSLNDARFYIKKLKHWNFRFQNRSNIGMNHHYRCNFVPKKGPQCEAQKYLVLNKHTKEAKLYENKCSHTHANIMREAQTKTKWLLKQLNKQTRNTLLAQGFRVLIAVGLKDCHTESDDRDISFHNKLIMLQQETVSGDNLQIKSEPLTDDENCTDIKVNLYERNDGGDKINVDIDRQYRKPIFTSEWIFEKEFPNEVTAREYFETDNLWKIDPKRVYEIRGGQARKIHYRCNKVKLNGPQCAASKCLLFIAGSDVVSLYHKNCEHTHDTIAAKFRNIKTAKKRLKKQRRCLINKFTGQTIIRKRGRPYKVICKNPINIKNEVNSNDEYVEDNTDKCSNSESNDLIFGKDWTFEKKFPNEFMALEYIEKDKLWKIDPRRAYSIRGGEARKVHYRCNKVKIKGPQCAAWKCILYTAGSNEISVYKKNCEHTHDSIADKFKIRKKFRRQHLYKSDSSDHNESSDSHANSMDFVTEDDSVKYDIKYLDDNEDGNESETENISATFKHKWFYEKMFVTMEEAETYLMDNKWNSVSTTNFRGQCKTYYRCNIVKQFKIHCDAQAYLFSSKITNKIVFYRNSVPHTHDQDTNNGLTFRTQIQNNIQKSLTNAAKQLPRNSNNPIDMEIGDSEDNSLMDKHTKWKLIAKIPNKDMVASYVNKQNTWQCRYASGRSARVYYYCTTKKCDAEMCIVYTKEFKKDSLVYLCGEHNHATCKTNDLPSHFKSTELLPDTFPDSNMIVKEELMINDDFEASYQNECDEGNLILESGILPDTYLNSNMIMKEELIINDELGPSYQNESDSELLHDPHSNMILKEQVNNNDKLLASFQNERVHSPFEGENNKKLSINQDWVFEKQFANMDEVNRFLDESNGLWKINLTTQHKIFYGCTYLCEPECTAQLLFMIQNSSGQVLYFTGDPHNHPVKNDTKPSSPIIYEIVSDDDDDDVEMIEPLCDPTCKPIPELNEFKFIEKFTNFPDALRKVRQENDHWVSISTKYEENGYRQHFSCNYSDINGACISRAFILCKHDSDEVLYYNTGGHSHTVNVSEVASETLTGILNPAKSTESTIEIVISDDSDKDSLNGESVENTETEWIFETKFDDYKTAKNYMKNLNLLSFKSNISKYGVKEYYSCNLDVNDIDCCPESKFLQYEDVTKDILMYNRNIRHIDSCTNIIPSLAPIQKKLTAVIDLVDSDDSDINDNRNETNVESTSISRSQLDIQKHWIHEKTFYTTKQALEYIKDQQIWDFHNSIKLLEGVQEFYRCNLASNSEEKCIASKVLYIKNRTNIISLYKTEINHSHKKQTRAARANEVFENLSDTIKDQIKQLVINGTAPKQILTMLNIDVSLDTHLRYCISKMRRNNRERVYFVEPPPQIIQNARTWLSQLSNVIPDDENTHYCVNYKIDYVGSMFRCFLSTRRLLQNALNSDIVNLVSKSKLQKQSNLITLVGTTDLDQRFHLFGIVIGTCKDETEYAFIFESIKKGVSECHKQIYQPKCLITDDNVEIHKAFIKSFGDSNDIIVSSNVVLFNISLKLANTQSITNSVKDQINEDIRKIQKLSSKHVVLLAVNLFNKKWQEQIGVPINEFLNYLKTNWIDENLTWFLGYRPSAPQTNNAIDGEYDLFKYLFTFTPIVAFTNRIQTHVEEISRCYTKTDDSLKYFVHKPTVPLEVYEKAIEWNNFEKQIEIVNDSTETRYYITTGNEKYIDEPKLEKYRSCRYETLEELFENQSQFCCVRRLKNQITLTCNCVYFLENFICVHSIGIEFVLKADKSAPNI